MRRQHYFFGQEERELKLLIKEKTGYCIRSRGILSQAFRRRSYCAEYSGKSNEMFEFLGDQVLGYYVVKIISERCGSISITEDYTFRIRENRFALIKQDLVNNETLAKIIDDWDIAKYLL